MTRKHHGPPRTEPVRRVPRWMQVLVGVSLLLAALLRFWPLALLALSLLAVRYCNPVTGKPVRKHPRRAQPSKEMIAAALEEYRLGQMMPRHAGSSMLMTSSMSKYVTHVKFHPGQYFE